MLRVGIYRPSQLYYDKLKDVFGKDKNISIYLYNQINNSVSTGEIDKYSELILNRFNSDRNVIKRTYKNRFNKFDLAAISILRDTEINEINVLDIAISDGRASYFFLDQLMRQFPNISFTASDISIVYDLKKKDLSSESYIITDHKNKIVEIVKPPFVWNMSRTEGRFYFINNILKLHYFRKALNELRHKEYKYSQKVELLHSDFSSLLNQSQKHKIINYNVFDETPEVYSVIRAMNLIHYGYFSVGQINSILGNIFKGLEVNGIFIEGSNEGPDTPVEGSVYQRNEYGFSLIAEPEKPSRIKELILSYKPDKQRV